MLRRTSLNASPAPSTRPRPHTPAAPQTPPEEEAEGGLGAPPVVESAVALQPSRGAPRTPEEEEEELCYEDDLNNSGVRLEDTANGGSSHSQEQGESPQIDIEEDLSDIDPR